VGTATGVADLLIGQGWLRVEWFDRNIPSAHTSGVPDPLFLGETIDAATHRRSGTAVVVKPSSLTTHGVIVGQTGSGKTGLAMVLVEEVLRSGVPVLLIDPKGDLANLALMFPGLSGGEFAPWVEGTDPAGVARQWSEGLASWGLGPADLEAWRTAVDVTVWTPGSSAARGLDLVGSLAARGPAGGDPEARADEIEGTTSGLLGLLGLEADPLTSREHILIANLLDRAWSEGRSMDLPGLIAQVMDPPIRKLGVLDLEAFFPASERMKLAMQLNGLAASPSFAAWASGEPLDIATLLRDPAGRPRASVISIAHLSDEERQFAITKILSALITWMRAQPGTESLRALVYIDEVAGMVPPTANPATKRPILTLMKQARAFGIGLVLATQNPVDVDYKVLSNATTWLVGRLQTERDRDRLLDGMRSAAGAVDPVAMGATISGLAKREFVLQRAGVETPAVMTSRWSMAYLRGPLTREQLSRLAPLGLATGPAASAVGPPPAAPTTAVAARPAPPSGSPAAPPASPPTVTAMAGAAGAAPLADDETRVAPAVADGIAVRWAVPSAPWLEEVGGDHASTRYAAAVVATVELRFDDAKAGIDERQTWEAVISALTDPFDAAAAIAVDHDARDFRSDPPDGARFVLPHAPIDSKRWWTAAQRELVARLVAEQRLSIPRNARLGLYGRPGETPESFAARCERAADEQADVEGRALRSKLVARIDDVRAALEAAESKKEALEQDRRDDRRDDLIATAGSILGGLLGGRKNTRALGRVVRSAAGSRTRGGQERSKMAGVESTIERKRDELAELEDQLSRDILAIEATWTEAERAVDSLEIDLERSDVRVVGFSLCWIPVRS
jgi:hypothetical protein